jgi:hypothetical protein
MQRTDWLSLGKPLVRGLRLYARTIASDLNDGVDRAVDLLDMHNMRGHHLDRRKLTVTDQTRKLDRRHHPHLVSNLRKPTPASKGDRLGHGLAPLKPVLRQSLPPTSLSGGLERTNRPRPHASEVPAQARIPRNHAGCPRQESNSRKRFRKPRPRTSLIKELLRGRAPL